MDPRVLPDGGSAGRPDDGHQGFHLSSVLTVGKVLWSVIVFLAGGATWEAITNRAADVVQQGRAEARVKQLWTEDLVDAARLPTQRQGERYGELFDDYFTAHQKRLINGKRTFVANLIQDPVESAHVEVHARNVHLETAVVDITLFETTNKTSGCKQWDGSFRLRRTGGLWVFGGKWQIDRRPDKTNFLDCSQNELRQREQSSVARSSRDPDGAAVSLPPSLTQIPRNEITATASSAAPAANGKTYVADNTLDGDPETAWNDGIRGPGLGETLRYSFAHSQRVSRVYLRNGYGTGALYGANARMKDVEVQTGAKRLQVRLRDQSDWQYIDGDFGDTSSVTLRVRSVYPGSQYLDVGLSELQLWS